MHWDDIRAKWHELASAMHDAWGEITGDEIAEIDGDREKLEAKLREKYDMTKEEAKALVDDFMKQL